MFDGNVCECFATATMDSGTNSCDDSLLRVLAEQTGCFVPPVTVKPKAVREECRRTPEDGGGALFARLCPLCRTPTQTQRFFCAGLFMAPCSWDLSMNDVFDALLPVQNAQISGSPTVEKPRPIARPLLLYSMRSFACSTTKAMTLWTASSRQPNSGRHPVLGF
ncbi:hypothetical protein CBL_00895 [Carabus blaptoides fortunei]